MTLLHNTVEHERELLREGDMIKFREDGITKFSHTIEDMWDFMVEALINIQEDETERWIPIRRRKDEAYQSQENQG